MEDNQIIELYWMRSEQAIMESQNKYGTYCRTIANNILHSIEDTEECTNDTWIKAWTSMPPNKPNRLSVFLGRITRNLALDRYRRNDAEKRGGGQVAECLDEISECIGDGSDFVEDYIIKEILNKFLMGLKEEVRQVFMLRYWYVYSVKDVAYKCGMSEGAVKMTLKRTRDALKEHLIIEGINLIK